MLSQPERKRGRPPKPPTPSMQLGQIIELRKLIETAVQSVPEDVARKRVLEFSEVVRELRPWILQFLACGYKAKDFVAFVKEQGIKLTEPEAKHLLLAAAIKEEA